MSYKDLKAQFDKLTPADFYDPDLDLEQFKDLGVADRVRRSITAEQTYRFWLLRLMFEIHGDLDFIAARMREQALATKALSDCYEELLKLQKERATK